MSPRALVVIGASAGGVEALRAVTRGLPPDLDAAVLVVLHIPRTAPSALPRILDRAGPLPAAQAVDGEPLQAGRIYVAPMDHHLLVMDGRVRLSREPAETGHRPAINPLFRSAARLAGECTLAMVLSGFRADGTAGAAAVRACGGRVLVQDPGEAMHPSMPSSVIEYVGCDRVCRAAEMGAAVAELIQALPEGSAYPCSGPAAAQPAEAVPTHAGAVPTHAGPADHPEATPADLAGPDASHPHRPERTGTDLAGTPAGLACPSCHRGLFEVPGEPPPRYRCRVGHDWSPQNLLARQASAFEGALRTALRCLEEKAALARRLGESAQRRGAPSERHDQAEQQARHTGRLIRELLEGGGTSGGLPGGAEPTG